MDAALRCTQYPISCITAGTPASSADNSGGAAPITSYGRCLRRVKVQVSRIRCAILPSAPWLGLPALNYMRVCIVFCQRCRADFYRNSATCNVDRA